VRLPFLAGYTESEASAQWPFMEFRTEERRRTGARVKQMEEMMACSHCADGIDGRMVRRIQVLQLLTLIEHPNALPPASALRIARELLALIAQGEPRYRCDQVISAERRIEAAA
jgi:hypothetical protein